MKRGLRAGVPAGEDTCSDPALSLVALAIGSLVLEMATKAISQGKEVSMPTYDNWIHQILNRLIERSLGLGAVVGSFWAGLVLPLP